MFKHLFSLLALATTTSALAFGEAGQWSSGYAQGTTEYTAVVSKGNALYIACSDNDPVFMTLTVNGVKYGSSTKKGFDLIVDGKTYKRPYETATRDQTNTFVTFWWSLPKATSITARTSDGKTLELPLKNKAVVPKSYEGCKLQAEL